MDFFFFCLISYIQSIDFVSSKDVALSRYSLDLPAANLAREVWPRSKARSEAVVAVRVAAGVGVAQRDDFCGATGPASTLGWLGWILRRILAFRAALGAWQPS